MTCRLCARARPLDDDGHCEDCATRPQQRCACGCGRFTACTAGGSTVPVPARCSCGALQTYPRDDFGRITVTCTAGHQIARTGAAA